MSSFANITLCSSSVFYNTNVSALSYSSNVGIGFTFNPTLSVDISPSNLVIDNLTPSITADSNAITVSVATNAAYGYALSAIMNGNNSNLTHTNSISVFSSIATDASLSSLTDDNIWGYSYKNNMASSPTWSNYSGLSNEANKVLFNTDDNANGSINFKIAAKASEAQPSGAYTGTINFTAVSKPMPTTIQDIAYMQTFGELSSTDLASVKSSMIMGTTYTLKDARDEQEYTVAKLADGKIWMTKNLNLAGGTEITSELSDIPANYTLPTANGFQEGNKLPESSQEGFSDNTQAYVYNTGNSTDNCANPGCYSYYSWHAATAGSGVNITANNTDAPYSICPKGWELPNSRTTVAANSDFYKLAVAYGMNPEDTYDKTFESGSNFYELAGPETIPNFLITNEMFNKNFSASGGGRYWSSSVVSRGRSYSLMLASYGVYTNLSISEAYGVAIRCLIK